jgi:TetR/AcrR family transcriptional repressor of nem operon
MPTKYVQHHILLAARACSGDTLSGIHRGTPMPYPAGHRDATRRKIIDSARRLFNRHGFDNVSLGQIMADTGLTHGGFYSYFDSKSDLYAEVLRCFFTDPNWKNRWEGVHVDLAAADAAPQIIRAYLSHQHFDDVDNSCPMVALPSYVARSNKSAKSAFENVFRAMVTLLEKGVPSGRQTRRATAQAVAALCVGGMVVARATVDRAYADELRDSCMAVALDLAGWSDPSKSSKTQKRRKHRTPTGSATKRRAA